MPPRPETVHPVGAEVLFTPAIEKLRFVHQTIAAAKPKLQL
jgi:hypothetical protein